MSQDSQPSKAHGRPRKKGHKDYKELRRTSEAHLARLDLPDGCTIATLTEKLSRDRGRPIQLMSVALGAQSPCGMWLAMDDMDLIVVEANVSALHRDHIVAHELAHMLCCHSDAAGADSMGIESFVPHLDPQRVRDVLGRTSYTTEEEQAAEMVASLILERVTRPPVESVWAVPSDHADAVARIENSLNPPD